MSGNAMTICYGAFRAAIGPARPLAGALGVLLALIFCPLPAASEWLSKSDARTYTHAFAAANQGNWKRAHGIAARAKDRLPAKVIEWMEMTERRNRVPFAEIARFIQDHPNWPDQRTLRLRAEEALDNRTPAADIVAWLTRHPPLTTPGMVLLGESLEQIGRTSEAKTWLRRAWVEGNFGSKQERAFLRSHRKLLTKADHMARLDDLLWRGQHRQANRMLRRVDKSYHPIAIARMRLRAFSGGVDSAVAKVPEALQWTDAGFMYERARWRRKKNRDEETLEILRRAPKALVDPERWWTERSIIARSMVRKGFVSEAYRVAAEHGLSPDSAERHAEAEFLAGWIALRFLNDRKVALKHFETLYAAVRYPISRSRAAYWAGRVHEALRNRARAAEWFEIAASHDTTYYGQLAAQKLNEGYRPKPAAILPQPTGADLAAFNREEMVEIVHRLAELKQKDLLRPFLVHLARKGGTPEQRVLAGRLALEVKRPDLGVIIAREAYRAGVALPDLAYPVIRIPDGEPEKALLLAIARQESNFETAAESWAGARGLMQLMPATARAMAQQTRTRYSKQRLVTDPEYNLKLGRAYLARMIDRFDGSYVRAIASYNAGPTAVARWVRNNGDPRQEDIDLIDWIEMIPYRETRNYVQRVLENLQVYRSRLGLPRYALLEQEGRPARGQ